MTIALLISQSLTTKGLANIDADNLEMAEPLLGEEVDHEFEQTREELLALIKEIEDKITNNELTPVEFTVETWSNLTSALNIARNILEGDDSTTVDLQWAMLTLENSLENLERISLDALLAEYHNAYETLRVAIGEAESLQSDSTLYTETSWAHFVQGLEVAKVALEDSSVGVAVSDIKQETSKLEDAHSRLHRGVTALDFNDELISKNLDEITNELQSYISELETLNLEATNFTETSWSRFSETYEKTKNVNLYPEESSASAIIAHTNYLQEILDSLKVSFEKLEAVKIDETDVVPGVKEEAKIDSDIDSELSPDPDPGVEVEDPEEESVTNQPDPEVEADLPRSGQLLTLAPIIGVVAVLASLIIMFYKSKK